jgi:hypothetical protein
MTQDQLAAETIRRHRIDLAEARRSRRESDRIANLIDLIPAGLSVALDVGARDGFLSVAMTDKVARVVALDLVEPEIQHPRVTVVAGDANQLLFADGSFDLVLCAEVLEHIPPADLEKVCRELARVSGRYVLIGVPFRQDTRFGRLTCQACGRRNPPWGHVNSFDESRLHELFGQLNVIATRFVGSNRNRTNFVSAALNDLAGNPWGFYRQEETCIACGARFEAPTNRTVASRIASKAAYLLDSVQHALSRPRPTWIHVLFEKRDFEKRP